MRLHWWNSPAPPVAVRRGVPGGVRRHGRPPATADQVAGELGSETVIADVLLGDKAAKGQEIQGRGKRVAMVGDGINDAAALVMSGSSIIVAFNATLLKKAKLTADGGE